MRDAWRDVMRAASHYGGTARHLAPGLLASCRPARRPGVHHAETESRAPRVVGKGPARVYELRPGRLLTDDWLLTQVAAGDGTVIGPASLDFVGAAPFRRPGHDGWRRPVSDALLSGASVVEADAVASLLTGGGSGNYFLWLHDVLPRVAILRASGLLEGDEVFAVPRLERDFQRETLTLLGLDGSRLLEVSGPTDIRAGRLLAGVGHRPSGEIPGWITRLLRASLPRTDVGTPTERIYVTRGDTRLRRVRNEEQVIASLAARGVRPVSLTGMPVADQIRLFARARLVVSAHGAGLTNTTFCAPGTSVVEVVGGAWRTGSFEQIAHTLGLEHHAVDAASTVPGRWAPTRVRDVHVDVARLTAALADVEPAMRRSGRGHRTRPAPGRGG